MKKIILFLLMVAIFMNIAYATVTYTDSWDTDYYLDWEPISKIFTFTSDLTNDSVDISLSKSGDHTSWLSLNRTAFTIYNSSSVYVNFTLDIPSSAYEDTYTIWVKDTSKGISIPIVYTVKESNITVSVGKCRLDPMPDSYTLPVVSGSPAMTQQFSVMVSKYCEDEVDIKTPLILGNTQTADGPRPISLTGGTDLGIKEAKEEGTFNILFDSSSLPTGTYTPYILVYGYYQGEKLSTKIDINVIVSYGATPVSGAGTLPTYSFSATDLTLNNSYTISTTNLNPNFEPFLEASPFIYGESVDVSASGWTFKFKPVKTGKTILRIYTYYKGAPLGDITEKEIRITSSGYLLGTMMKFDFYPKLDEAVDGEKLAILIKDNETNTVIPDVTLYLNGEEIDENSFIVESGKDYTITASKSGFPSIEEKFKLEKGYVSISFSPTYFEINTPMTMYLTPVDVLVTLDGNVIVSPFTVSIIGVHEIKGTKAGFKTYLRNLTFTEEFKIVGEFPEDVDFGDEYIIDLSKAAEWSVTYKEDNESMPQTLYSSNSEQIVFTPEDKGIYEIYIRGEVVQSYDKTGLAWLKWVIYIIIGVMVVYITYRTKGFGLFGGGGRKKIGFGVGGGEEVSEVIS